MGNWGHDVGESDVFVDVYDRFFEAYNKGATPQIASDIVFAEFAETFSDSEDRYDAHYAIALATWETKALDPSLLEEVERFINSGADLKNWADRGADSDLEQAKREAALKKFLAKLLSPRTSKKRRKKPKLDFSLVPLLELPSPDGKKTFSIAETYTNGRYVHTVAMMEWAVGGGSVFHTVQAGLEFSGKWIDAHNLEINIPKSIKDELERGPMAQVKLREAVFSGDLVKLQCKFV